MRVDVEQRTDSIVERTLKIKLSYCLFRFSATLLLLEFSGVFFSFILLLLSLTAVLFICHPSKNRNGSEQMTYGTVLYVPQSKFYWIAHMRRGWILDKKQRGMDPWRFQQMLEVVKYSRQVQIQERNFLCYSNFKMVDSLQGVDAVLIRVWIVVRNKTYWMYWSLLIKIQS